MRVCQVHARDCDRPASRPVYNYTASLRALPNSSESSSKMLSIDRVKPFLHRVSIGHLLNRNNVGSASQPARP
ncbi:unnamed protein product [Linum trigynum]|uniref:Uncharacterized protein n=1 Tax=Linum trigynum TaxID=586398 RepID=A0AAV2FGF7_9ROSI